jgi:hypothetical protein
MNDEALAKAIDGLNQRLDRIESRLSKADLLLDNAPGAIGAIADSIDDMAEEAAANGGNFHDRGREAAQLVERVTRPEALAALSELAGRLEKASEAARMAEQLPGAAAAVADSIDDMALQAIDSGLDLPLAGRRLGRLVEFAIWTLQSGEFAELFETDALRATATAWSETVQEKPDARGIFSLWRASRDPDVRRALDFMIRFTKRVGILLDERSADSSEENN